MMPETPMWSARLTTPGFLHGRARADADSQSRRCRHEATTTDSLDLAERAFVDFRTLPSPSSAPTRTSPASARATRSADWLSTLSGASDQAVARAMRRPGRSRSTGTGKPAGDRPRAAAAVAVILGP